MKKIESVDEFLARGGQVQKLPPAEYTSSHNSRYTLGELARASKFDDRSRIAKGNSKPIFKDRKMFLKWSGG